MKLYQAHLISHPKHSNQSMPLRWDGEKFREGFKFDAEDFNTPYEAQAILREHGKNDINLIPVVFTIEINSMSYSDMYDNMEEWTIGDNISFIVQNKTWEGKIVEIYPDTGLLEVNGSFGKDWVYTTNAKLL